MAADANPPDSLFAIPPPVRRSWKPLIAGVIAVALVVIALVLWLAPKPNTTRTGNPNQPSALAPYAANLPLSDEKMSTAGIPVTGGQLYYVEGKVENTGTKTVTGATVEVTFRDSLGKICQREDLPLKVIVATEPAVDVTDLSHAPLAPNQSRTFQLTLEHISADWNSEYPELRVIAVSSR